MVRYGPFFVPTGKNVFNCDVAKTVSFLLPADTREIRPNLVSVVVSLGAFALALSVVFVPALLTLGGGLLLAKGPESASVRRARRRATRWVRSSVSGRVPRGGAFAWC